MKTIKNVRRFDLGKITSVERTPQGFLKVPGFATRTGVFTYIDANGQVRRELRHPDDVFEPESLSSLKNAPVTLEHPPVMLNPQNVKQYTKGWTTDHVEVDRDMVATDLIIAVDDAIRAVEELGIRELSAGYVADLEEEPGVYNGAQYDMRQKNIRYNHLAIVKKGRAGPEARLRMDSADAILQVPNQPANQFAKQGENDSEENEGSEATKTIIISGEKVELPSGVADIIQDMMDRYDQMRGEVAKLKEESMAKRNDDYGMKDVDISQKNVSPQVMVTQMAPDGRGATKKINEGDEGGPSRAKGIQDEDQHGVVGGSKPNSYEGGSKALQDAEMPEKKDEDEKKGDLPPEKKDYEGASQAGVAMSPADRLKHEIEELEGQLKQMQSQKDSMQAKLDEYANQSFGQGESKPGGDKMDSASWRQAVSKRVKLIRTAEKMVPSELASRFDSLSDHEIMATAIKHCSPNTDLRGKSDVYLETRFDLMAENHERSASLRKEMGSGVLNNRMDAFGDSSPHEARLKSIHSSKNEWQSPLSAVKK